MCSSSSVIQRWKQPVACPVVFPPPITLRPTPSLPVRIVSVLLAKSRSSSVKVSLLPCSTTAIDEWGHKTNDHRLRELHHPWPLLQWISETSQCQLSPGAGTLPCEPPRSCSRREQACETQKLPHNLGTAGAAPPGPTETAVIEPRRLRQKQTVRTGRPSSVPAPREHGIVRKRLTRGRNKSWKTLGRETCRQGWTPPTPSQQAKGCGRTGACKHLREVR